MRVHFIPNVPQQLKMLSPNGGYDLDGQWAFELQDGRVLVANQDLERKINLLELAPGEQFCVAKYWNGERQQPPRWEAWRVGVKKREEEAAAKPIPQMPVSSPAPKPKGLWESSPPRPPATWQGALIEETKYLTEIYSEALRDASQYGISVRPEDVRALLITAYINMKKGDHRG